MPWNLGIPDIRGGDWSQVGKTIANAGESVGGTILQNRAADDLLQVMSKNGFGSEEDVKNLAGKSLGAKQQYLGSVMTGFQAYQSAQAQNQAQIQLLHAFQNNPNLMQTKMNVSLPPHERPLGVVPPQYTNQPVVPGQTPTQSPVQQNTPAKTNEPQWYVQPQGKVKVDTTPQKFAGGTGYIYRDEAGNEVGLMGPDGQLIPKDQVQKFMYGK